MNAIKYPALISVQLDDYDTEQRGFVETTFEVDKEELIELRHKMTHDRSAWVELPLAVGDGFEVDYLVVPARRIRQLRIHGGDSS